MPETITAEAPPAELTAAQRLFNKMAASKPNPPIITPANLKEKIDNNLISAVNSMSIDQTKPMLPSRSFLLLWDAYMQSGQYTNAEDTSDLMRIIDRIYVKYLTIMQPAQETNSVHIVVQNEAMEAHRNS